MDLGVCQRWPVREVRVAVLLDGVIGGCSHPLRYEY